MAQGVGPEFKSQYCKKQKQTNKTTPAFRAWGLGGLAASLLPSSRSQHWETHTSPPSQPMSQGPVFSGDSDLFATLPTQNEDCKCSFIIIAFTF
jgi:hypothetical protein